MITKHIRGSILAALIIAGGVVGGAIVFAAESANGAMNDEAGTAGVAFPVAELGNCASREECHAYCEQGEHMDACIAFAKARGLMNKDEAARSEKFSKRLKEKKTPGGCTSPASCRAYCEDVTHLDECMEFAESQDFKGEEFARGKKLNMYLKGGGAMPGGCTSRMSCEAYCNDFSHAEECYRFAEEVDVAEGVGDIDAKGGGPKQKVSPEHLKRLGELSKKGETPGGCMNKDACEEYCEQTGHMEECIAFGEKVGFMKKDEADRARKFMSKGGPGGCSSPESCRDYCNDPANQETCFAFAKENGLIPEEEMERMQEGWMRMRQGLENAPMEVRECLTSALGETIIDDIQSGELVPSPAIGDRVRGCFEKFGAQHKPQQVFFDAPENVKACLKEKLGDTYAEVRSGKSKPTPEIADTFRVCFQQVEFERSNGWGGDVKGDRGAPPGPGEQRGPDPKMFERLLRSAPPEIQLCLKEKVGERLQEIVAGELMPGPEMGEAMRACFESFRPEGMNVGPKGEVQMEIPNIMRGEMIPPSSGEKIPMPTPVQGNLPPRTMLPLEQMQNFMNQFPLGVATCLREKLGEEGFVKIAVEGRTPELESAIRFCVEQLHVVGGEAPLQFMPPRMDGGTPVEMAPMDGTMAPTQEPPRIESMLRSFRQQLLGAVISPFVAAWRVLER